MKDFEHYLGIVNHDIQMANNQNELKNYVASLLCDYDRLLQEKEELEELLRDMGRYALDNEAKIDELEYQQKEFIKYLEEPIKIITDGNPTNISEYTMGKLDTLKEILSKYNEIIGGENEK